MSKKDSQNEALDNHTDTEDSQVDDLHEIDLSESSSDLPVDEVNSQDETDESLIADLEAQIADLRNANLRKIAEFENYRKRTERERVQLLETAKIAALQDFLPVYEDLQRTLEALESTQAEGVSQIEDGVKLIENKFSEILSRHNVVSINKTGVPFDVNLHDALLRQKPEDESVESDTVLQVLENGYRIGDRTIRHAKVIVSE